MLAPTKADQVAADGGQADADRSPRGERRLVRAAKKGRPEAIATLVRSYWSDAQRVGYLITQDALAAEDVAQESLAAALDSLDRFDDSRPFGPWLAGIAAHKAHDWVRCRARRPEAILDEEDLSGELEGDPAIDPARDFASSEVANALRELDLRQREAIVLRHLLGYQPVEIAEIVGAPAATVRTRLHRGLKALRASLGHPDEGSIDEQAG